MILKRILIVCFVLFISAFLFTGIYTGSVYLDYLKDKELIFSKLEDFSRVLDNERETENALDFKTAGKNPAVVYDRQGRVITKYQDDSYKLSPIKEMPYYLTRGFIYIEDRAFYIHRGINYKTLTAAFYRNIITMGRSGGGSTISQQLAKMLFTRHERSMKRKIYELFCTFELESRFSKNDILKIYLNINYMGHGNYGVANAANFYFNKTAAELTAAESALLIGMNRSPERFSPIRNRANAEYIQKYVMSKFIEAGYINENDADYEIKRFWDRFDARTRMGEQSIWRTEINNSGYLTEIVRQILEAEFDYDRIMGGGLIVETAFDLEKQNLAERTLNAQVQEIRKRVKDTSAAANVNYDDSIINKIEASFASVDFKTGEVYSLVGGSGYTFGNQLNRALRARRQIGSSVKPFIYAKALDTGYIGDLQIHPFTKFKDEIVSYQIGGTLYEPKNYNPNHKYGNMVTLYDAIKTSLNTVAVAVMNVLDFKETAELIKEAGRLPPDSKRVPEVLSLALGTAEMSSLELAVAYSIFARAGVSVKPVMIKRIYDINGNVYYDYKRENNPMFNFLQPEYYKGEKQLIRPETAYEVLQMMASVFEPGGTGYWAARRSGLNKTAYGKSGTTQEFKDGWFAGITNNEVTAVWVGIDSGESLLSSGEGVAGNIWAEYNQRTASGIGELIPVPRNMRLVKVDRTTGLAATAMCPDKFDFYFRADGPIPEKCYIHGADLPLLLESKL